MRGDIRIKNTRVHFLPLAKISLLYKENFSLIRVGHVDTVAGNAHTNLQMDENINIISLSFYTTSKLMVRTRGRSVTGNLNSKNLTVISFPLGLNQLLMSFSEGGGRSIVQEKKALLYEKRMVREK